MTNKEARETIIEERDSLKANPMVKVEDCLYEALDCAIKALDREPKIGHWILDETDNSITCNKCGCLICANDISNGEAHYCPNCGADMRELQAQTFGCAED